MNSSSYRPVERIVGEVADTTFTRMQEAMADDYRIIGRHSLEFFARLPDRPGNRSTCTCRLPGR
jgi:hypothetical protein